MSHHVDGPRSIGDPAADVTDLSRSPVRRTPRALSSPFYRRLADTGRPIPTILVTAYPNDVDRVRALNDGVVGYLRKSLDEQLLTQCLRAALDADEP